MVLRSSSFSTLSDLEHVVESVVERAEIGIDLFLQGAGQEAELFAGFDRRARENDARHFLAHQRGNAHGDGEIGLAGAGGSDAEDQIVALDGFEVAALVDGLRGEHLLAEVALPAAVDQRAQADLRIFGDDAQIAVQVAVVEDVTFAHQRDVILQYVFGARHIFRFAFEFERIVDQVSIDPEAGFNQADILVAGAEEAFDASADLHTGSHSSGGWIPRTGRELHNGQRHPGVAGVF